MQSVKRMKAVISEIKGHADPQRALILKRFFKTERGEYGEGDTFLGLTVPQIRQIAKKYPEVTLEEALQLLRSKIHEQRFLALVFLVRLYQKGDESTKKEVFQGYLSTSKFINNWDLVDTSTPQIVGDWCYRKNDRHTVLRLAKSKDLWQKRIGVLATFTFIRNNDVDLILQVAELLLEDKNDLIHKAIGWMLREAEKRVPGKIHAFLDDNASIMPRTMLRYAIERLPNEERKKYMDAYKAAL